MGKYSIKDLEKLSGIKAHTIRIWEKRYALISPRRTDTNIRYYDDNDLRKIINVSLLNNHGIKISRIASLSDTEINLKITELSATQGEMSLHVDQLVVAMVELDEEKFEKVLAALILRYGFERTIVEIVYPFLDKVGVLWQTENISPAQEHFISNLIRQKIIVAIDGLPLPAKDATRVMLFLPENELHEIGLLFIHYLVRKSGCRTFYLGQSVPYADIKSVYGVHHPDVLITAFISSISKDAIDTYIGKLSKDFKKSRILVSGYQLLGYKTRFKNVIPVNRIADLISLI